MARQTQPRPSRNFAAKFFDSTSPPETTAQLPFPLYLSKHQKATLLIPASLTRKEYDLLKEQIQNSLSVIEATILTEEEQPEN
jgi:hypothetical protein